MAEDIQFVLDQLIERITCRFAPRKIVLFGSYSVGRPGQDSDIDLLIVMDVEGSTRQRANEIDLLMADRVIPMDFIVLTPEQYERQKNVIGTIVHQAERQGKVIYERVA
jgi:predicted nucleotidyltransferase